LIEACGKDAGLCIQKEKPCETTKLFDNFRVVLCILHRKAVNLVWIADTFKNKSSFNIHEIFPFHKKFFIVIKDTLDF